MAFVINIQTLIIKFSLIYWASSTSLIMFLLYYNTLIQGVHVCPKFPFNLFLISQMILFVVFYNLMFRSILSILYIFFCFSFPNLVLYIYFIFCSRQHIYILNILYNYTLFTDKMKHEVRCDMNHSLAKF